jgi:uncharacterized protein (TIGR01777 family)
VKVVVTGASGLIGRRLVAALRERGDDITVLSRDPDRAAAELEVPAAAWSPLEAPAPAAPLAGCDGVVHLAGEPVAQRWSTRAKRAIRDSRVVGTANLVAGLRAAEPRPRVLVSASAVGYYGPRGDERLDEHAAPGSDFLAEVCVGWEREALVAAEPAAAAGGAPGARVVTIRTGVVLDRGGGALAKMLMPFRAGVGGPVAGGSQYMPWIHVEDVVGLYVTALDDERWHGAVNASAPEPVTNRQFSAALGRALHRPAVLPIPALALRALYGEMAEIVTEGQRAIPAAALSLGYAFRHTDLDQALRAALA